MKIVRDFCLLYADFCLLYADFCLLYANFCNFYEPGGFHKICEVYEIAPTIYAIFIKIMEFETKICEFHESGGFHEFCEVYEITPTIYAIFAFYLMKKKFFAAHLTSPNSRDTMKIVRDFV
jgi:Fe-S-cluster containining protein